MNVGIMTTSSEPQSGGLYTFESELLHAITRLQPESTHRFFLMGHDLRRDHAGSISIIDFNRRSGPALWSRLLGKTKPEMITKILEYRIDIIWYLSPFTGMPTQEVPYVFPVWDLAHLTVPFFPEVSAAGQWHEREAMYSNRIGRAACVFVGTEVGKKEISTFYRIPNERIRVIPMPTPTFEGTARADLAHMTLSSDYLLYPANFWPHKNHVNLLLALRLLNEKFSFAPKLILIGSDKGNRGYVQEKIRELGLQQQVSFEGFVARERLVMLYRNALALVYVSLLGPDNLPPLEAFALGCPVIATDMPGSREQLGDAALLVDTLNPQQIAAAIHRIYTDQGIRSQLITRGLERKSFMFTDYAREVFNFLDKFEPLRRCWTDRSFYNEKQR